MSALLAGYAALAAEMATLKQLVAQFEDAPGPRDQP